MTYRLLVAWIEQHGASAEVVANGVRIGIAWSRREEDGSFTMGVEWSMPVTTWTQAAHELGY